MARATLAMRQGSGGGGGGSTDDESEDDSGSSRYQGYNTPGVMDRLLGGGGGSTSSSGGGGGSSGGASDRYGGDLYDRGNKAEQIVNRTSPGAGTGARAYTDDNSTQNVDQGSVNVGDVQMDVTANAGDGFFEIAVEMSGTVNAGFRDLSVPNNTVDVVMTFEGPASNAGIPPRIYNSVNDQVAKVQQMLGRFPTGLPQNPRKVISGDMRPLPSFGLPLKVDVFGNTITGRTPVSNSVRIPKNGQFGKFPVITTPNTDFRVDDLPPVKIRVTAKPKGGLKNLPVIGGKVASTVVSIPASTFIEEVSIDEFGCAELYPDIDAKLDRIPNDVQRKVELAKEQAQKLQDLEGRLLSNTDDASSLKNIGRDMLRRGNVGEISNIIREAKSISPHQFNVSDWKSALSEADDMLGNVKLNRCNDNFNNRISDARTRIQSVDKWQSIIDDKYFYFDKMELPDPTADLPDVPCVEQFSTIAGHIEDLQDKLGPLGSGAKFELPPTPSDLQLIRTQIENRIKLIKEQTDSGSKCRNQFMGHMTDIRNRINSMGTRTPQIPIAECASEFSGVQDQINNIENKGGIYGKGERNVDVETEIIDPTEIDWTLREFISDVNNARGVVRNNVPNDSPCFNHFMNRLDTVQDKVSAVDFSDSGDGDRPEPPEAPELDCSDVPKGLRNRVASIEGAAEQWTGKRQIARKEDRKGQLLNEVNELESTVQDQVDDENPCREKLLSRIQQSRDRILATGTRPTTAIPCKERFPEVGQKVEEFEDDVIDLRPPVGPQQIQEFARRGNNIADQIDQQVPSDDPCRSEMASRVRNLTDRVDKLTSQVRIQATADESDKQRRNELLNNLMESLDGIEPNS